MLTTRLSVQLESSWQAALASELELPYMQALWAFLAAEKEAGKQVFPESEDIFNAFTHTPLTAVKVVVLGQDPYPTPSHANGLAFSVTPETPLPKSLRNIFQELAADTGQAPDTGDLGHWADQGVLLLNTALSVAAGAPGAHAKLGWSALTKDVLARLSDSPRAFVLWGNHAQSFRPLITGDHHFLIECPHPSPLSAYRGFFGSRPFSRVNTWLKATGQNPIRWA